MRSRLKLAVVFAFCAFTVAATAPRHPIHTAPLSDSLPSFTSHIDFLRSAAQQQRDDEARWYASLPAPPPPRARREGTESTHARAVVDGSVWDRLAQCESGGDAAANTGNGFFGAFQFTASTWRSMGTGYALASDAPYSVQLDAAQRLQARSGWSQWPACSIALGLR